MGTRITKVTPLEGVSAETAGAVTLFISEKLGIPVSTTHTITGSIMGVGATKRLIGRSLGSHHQPALGMDSDHSGKCHFLRNSLLDPDDFQTLV